MTKAWIALNPMPEGIGALWNGLLILALLMALSQHLMLMLRSASLRGQVRKLPHPIRSLRSLRDGMEQIGEAFSALEGATTHVRRGAEIQGGKLVLAASPTAALSPRSPTPDSWLACRTSAPSGPNSSPLRRLGLGRGCDLRSSLSSGPQAGGLSLGLGAALRPGFRAFWGTSQRLSTQRDP